MNILLLLLVFSSFGNVSYAQIVSWSVNNTPSLVLTDKVGVVTSNSAIMAAPNQQTNRIRIEDIVLLEEHSFTELFIRFEKKKFSSFVKINIYDAFTDTIVFSHDFDEQDILTFTNDQMPFTRVYIVAELHGNDIELRSIGMGMQAKKIIDDVVINKENIVASQDTLQVSITLNEAANVNLLLYDRKGNVCKKFLINKVLNTGTYQFVFDPQEVIFDYLGDKRYYVWLQATNLRSKPVEIIKTIKIVP